MSDTSLITAAGSSRDADRPVTEPPRLVRVSRSKTIEIPLDRKQLVCGREDSCDVVIENDAQVSREHCGFRVYSDGAVTVTDFGSSNGTFVNGERIFEETPLAHDDRVRFGDKAVFSLKMPQPAKPEPVAKTKADAPTKPVMQPPKSDLDKAAAELAEELSDKSYASVMRELVNKTKPSKRRKAKEDKPNEYW